MRFPLARLPLCLALAAGLLAACQMPAPTPQPSPPTTAPVAQAVTPATVPATGRYRLDAEASQLQIYVFRGGSAARLGHDHVLTAPRLGGEIELPDVQPASARFTLRLRLDELLIDAPALRAQTGASFAGERSASDIEGTQRNLLKSLDAEQHPEVLVQSQGIVGDWPLLVADVAVTLHGARRVERVPLWVSGSGDGSLRTRGRFAIRQSDYGIRPYSALGGLLAVQDTIVINFDLIARAAP